MIRTDRAHMHVAALSHPGLTGKQNEDRFGVSSYVLAEDDPTPALLAVVADGIGGHRAGEVAAEIAVNAISEQVAASDARHPLRVLGNAVQAASNAIRAAASDQDDREGMGATCACVWVVGDRLFTASVGDSRVYLIRGGGIHQLTTDHTWVQEALERGILTPDQVRDHPNIHVIRRYLGSEKPPEADFRLRRRPGESDAQAESNQGLVLRGEDVLLLCSDGLSDLVYSDEILWAIRSAKNLQAAAQALIDLANERGGHDNITVVLLSMPVGLDLPERPKRYRGVWVAIVILAALTLAFGTALAWRLLGPGNGTPTPSASPPPSAALTATLPASPSATRPPPTRTPGVTVTPAASSTPGTAGPTYTPWPTNTP